MPENESSTRCSQPSAGADESAGSAAVEQLLMVVADAHGKVLHVSEACARMTGRRRDDLLRRHIDELLVPVEKGGQAEGVHSRRARSRGWQQHATVLRNERGEERLVHWSSTPLHAPSEGRLFVFTGVDVTEHASAGEVTQDSDARLRSILEAAVDGIITAGADGVIESVNPAVERIFGYSAAELVGQKMNVLMPEPYRSSHDGYMARYLSTGERRIIGIGREVEGLRRDGTVFPIELAVGEVVIPGRRMFTGIIRDITQRRKAEEEARLRLDQLAHASRLAALGELTSSIAHEINQPLAAIVSFADASLRMMRSGKGSSEMLTTALEQIAAQGARAGDIVKNLRQFVRKGGSGRERVNVNTVVKDMLGLLSHDIRMKRVRVTLALDEQLPRVTANRVQVEQVTLNLVQNAIDALTGVDPKDRRVVITTARVGSERVEVAVIDNGTGLPAEGAQRVFDTFFTTKPEGMGIGLSICKSLVEAHGGRLTAESNDEGGATFRFTLPLEAAADG
ncbi:PAS domain-containing sensor histidine kinase [Hydrogenophaga sp.]|uniref:PAS domain-containing sensor histidine kinase n=1 Tax=Hydrogenophaga sp. TaxID=1904254 RepID=UPI00260D7BAE|nr:PAS domain-containing sensor histidine kinase [Hydrogenophaga sp.]MCW5655947.1 PAS domain S-box protein [Hydrogenophaga sp.]